MKVFQFTCILVVFSGSVFAQNIPQNPNRTDAKGLKQGKWTLTYKENWEPAAAMDSMAFYRILQFKNNKPVGISQAYYATGELHHSGKLIDLNPDKFDGLVNYYSQQGHVIDFHLYKQGIKDEEGSIIGLEKVVKEHSVKIPNHLDYAKACEHLGEAYENQGNLEKAETQYQTMRTVKGISLGKQHEDYAMACNDLGLFYTYWGKFDRSEPLLLEAKEILETHFGKMRRDYASTLNNLGLHYFYSGKYDQAELFYLESKAIKEQVLGKDHPSYAQSINNLAVLFHSQAKYTQAVDFYLEAIDIRERTSGKENTDYALLLRNLAAVYEELGRFSQTESLYIQAKSIEEKALGKKHIKYAETCNNLAVFYYNQGRYELAEPLHLEAKEIREKVLGKQHAEYAKTLKNLASLYNLQGRNTHAESMYLEANAVLAKAVGKKHPSYANSCIGLGEFYRLANQPEKALQYFSEAKTILEAAFGKEHYEYAIACNNLAVTYNGLERFQEAEQQLEEAKKCLEKSLGNKHNYYASTIANLAGSYARQRKFAAAEPLFLEAKDTWKTLYGNEHPSYAYGCLRLGVLYEMQGKPGKSEPLWQEANKVYLAELGRSFSFLSEKEKGQFYAGYSSKFEQFHSFVVRRFDANPTLTASSYQIALATKGLLFNASQKIKDRILNSGEKQLIELYAQWKNQREFLAKCYNMSLSKREKQGIQLEIEENKANDLEKQLSASSELFAQYADNKAVNWKDVQKALKPGEAAIEIIRFRYHSDLFTDTVMYMALVVKPETKIAPDMVLLSNGVQLETRYINNYQHSIRFRLADSESYKAYWAPIAAKLKGIKTVYLSADGVYHSINVLGLQNQSSGKYVVDELELRLLTNTKDLVQTKPGKKRNQKAALFGFPTYQRNREAKTDIPKPFSPISTDTSQRFFDGENIQPLPGTRVEVDKIALMLKQAGFATQQYMEGSATENELKSLQNPQVLHIATHGFFLPGKEPNSPGTRSFGQEPTEIFENPLLRSGLLLANAEEGITEGGDGVLTAFEAMNLNLEQTELVVLSACETGLGEVRLGEGVFGLQRAFQTAGAENVVMSLWKVSDAVTQELMVSFYKNWLENRPDSLELSGRSKRQAFQSAQKALKSKYPHPYFWAGFVLVGG